LYRLFTRNSKNSCFTFAGWFERPFWQYSYIKKSMSARQSAKGLGWRSSREDTRLRGAPRAPDDVNRRLTLKKKKATSRSKICFVSLI
jgi:hypothetical protein